MKKVFVGISGGVDSSVSAYLLQKQGYDVTGVFIKVWYPDFISCDWRKEMHDAMRVCATLGIPFMLCDLEKEYKKGVIDYMIHEYTLGRTPNPDVMCNKEVKFKAFLNFARAHGASYIATGHYAQNIFQDGIYTLSRSVDTEKDQTYFLWNVNQDVLSSVLFPVGYLHKKEVRAYAKKAGLVTATKKDSQGLCFIGHVNMKEFLSHYITIHPGDVLDENGTIIGKHTGAILYTIGERHGFEIFHTSNTDIPRYIVSKDVQNNTITVSDKKQQISKNTCIIEQVNLISGLLPNKIPIGAMIRYRHKEIPCTVKQIDPQHLEITFIQPPEALAPGQSIVLYNDKTCIGGGIIS